MKKLLVYSIIFSMLWNNLAFATNSIIELDFKDSQTPQCLHTILPSYKIADVSHIEIDADKQQVVVHKLNKTDELPSEEDIVPVSPVTTPVILQKMDVINLPWDLEPEKLTLFILNHTAWLSPLDEDGYKLEFKGGLLGGMKPWGGGKKELVVDVTKFTVDCKGRNDYPSGTIGERFCNKNGNGSGNSGITVLNVSGTGGGGGSKGTSFGGSGWQSILGKGWAEIKANGDKARDRMQQQQENLKKLNTANQPFEIYKRKDIVIPDNPIPRIRPPQPVPPVPKDWEGKIGMIDDSLTRLSWNEMYYLARKIGVPDQVITDWRNYRTSHEVSLGSYLETKRKLEIEQAEKAKKVLQQKINSGEFFKEQIIGHLHPSQAKGISILKNQNGVISVYVPFIGLTYPALESEMTKQGAFLPTGYVITPFAEYLVNETGKILTNGNGLPSTENAVSIAYLVTGLLREVLEDTARSSQSLYTKEGFEKRLKEATRLHHNLSGITFSKKPGGMDSETFMTTFLLPRVQNMAFSLGGSSKSLVLSNFSGLNQSLNGNNQVSIYSAFTNLHYPVFSEDRGKKDSLLPTTYKPTKESEYLIGYTRSYVDANKIKHHIEELQSIGYLVHEAMEQAVEDCRNGDAWDKQEFYTCLKAMTLHHLQMSGAEWVNTKMGGYFTEQLLPRIIYQAAFHHARIPVNEKPFRDTVLKEWLKTDWVGLVKQVKFDGIPNIKDMIGLGGKFGGGGIGRLNPRIVNPFKAQSPVWKEFKNHKNGIKTNGKTGKEERFYDWDHKHNDIEVYGQKGINHLGSMNPTTGEMYKPPNPKYTIKDRV